jgi:alpha-mannosidase
MAVDLMIDWNESNALLKAEFPMNVSNEKASYDLGIGYVERGNNIQTAYEVFAQQWADITDADGSYGVAIMNDCKYGWDKPDNNTLRLTKRRHRPVCCYALRQPERN